MQIIKAKKIITNKMYATDQQPNYSITISKRNIINTKNIVRKGTRTTNNYDKGHNHRTKQQLPETTVASLHVGTHTSRYDRTLLASDSRASHYNTGAADIAAPTALARLLAPPLAPADNASTCTRRRL